MDVIGMSMGVAWTLVKPWPPGPQHKLTQAHLRVHPDRNGRPTERG
jgi:hypothetical protein